MPKRLQQEERRKNLLEVAGRCFLENGYGATTMSAIAKAVGGSKETLWRYFSNKESLFIAYIEHATAAFRQRLAPDLDPAAPLEQALRSFARHYIEEICSPESIGLHRLAIGESARSPEIGRLFYERAPRATGKLLSDFFERTGRLQGDQACRAARTLIEFCVMERYPVLFCVLSAADINAETIARCAVEDFLELYQLRFSESPADLKNRERRACETEP